MSCMPFYSLLIRLIDPCSGSEVCEGPYNYRHFLSLTNDSASFTVSEAVVCVTYGTDDCDSCVYMSEHSTHSLHLSFTCQTAVNDRIISGNLDSPEGGLDGLLQAVVCEDVRTPSHCNTISRAHVQASMHTCFTTHSIL